MDTPPVEKVDKRTKEYRDSLSVPEMKEAEPSQVEAKLDKVIGSIIILAGAIKALVEKDQKKEQMVTPDKPTDAYASVKPSTQEQSKEWFERQGVIPPKFRELCDQILSPDFELSIEYFDDIPNYILLVSVPQKYSSVPLKHQGMGFKDIRSKVINASLGGNGVRDYFGLIRKNLNNYFTQSGVQSPFVNA